MSQNVCQTVILWTDNMDTTNMDALLKQYRIKTSLTIITSNGTLYGFGKTLRKITFDMNIFLVNNKNEVLSQHHYFSREDVNWRSVKVTFSPMSPYVMINRKGKISGADVVFWNIMADKLTLKLEFVKGVSFNGMFQQVKYCTI